MTRPPKYVQQFIDHTGKPRFYFRHPSLERVTLPGLPWSPQFMAAYADDDVFGIDGTKFGNRLSDVVVIERRHDVKPANDGEHLINA